MAGTKARTRLTIATPNRLSIPSEDGRLRATFQVDASRRSDGQHAAQVTFRMRCGRNKPLLGIGNITILINENTVKVIEYDKYIPLRERWDTYHVPFLANQDAVLGNGSNKITFEFTLIKVAEFVEEAAPKTEWFEIEDVTLLFHAKHEGS